MKDNPVEQFFRMADFCDKSGCAEIGDEIDSLVRDGTLIKVAQYVSGVGVMLRGVRATQNCIRQKRLASDRPMQEVILECLSEFNQDGLKFYDDKWVRYASPDMQSYVNSFLVQSVKSGISLDTAARTFIEELTAQNDLSEDFDKVNHLWERVKEASLDKNESFEDLGELAKKAQQLGFWQGIKNLWRKWRGGEAQQVAGNLAEIHQNLQSLIRQATELQPVIERLAEVTGIDPTKNYQQFVNAVSQGYAQASSKRSIKSAQYPPHAYMVPQQPSPQQTTQQAVQQPVPQEIGRQAQFADVQQFLNASSTLARHIDNINNLIAKLRTFDAVTTDPQIARMTRDLFTTYNRLTSPFNLRLLNDIATKTTTVQAAVRSRISQQPTAAPAGEAPAVPVAAPPTASPDQQYLQALETLNPLLPPDLRQQIFGLIREKVGRPTEGVEPAAAPAAAG